MNTTLDLTQLDTLLSLPCRISESISMIETTILSSAIRKGMKFTHKVLCGETIVSFLERIYEGASTYNMDCTIYAQLASFVLAGKWPTNGGDIKLYLSNNETGHKLFASKIPQMGYIGCSDPEVYDLLKELPIASKGQWAIQIKKDEFLGLSVNCPIILSMEQWVTHLRNSLEKYYSEDRLSNKDLRRRAVDSRLIMLNSGKGLLECYFNLGQVNKWGFYPLQGQCSVKATWTPEGIILKDKVLIDHDNMELLRLKLIRLLSDISLYELHTSDAYVTSSSSQLTGRRMEIMPSPPERISIDYNRLVEMRKHKNLHNRKSRKVQQQPKIKQITYHR